MDQLLGGRYAIERLITEGGMAEVFLARDQAREDELVVVKRCRAHLGYQGEFATLFLREARIAALIHHPNVVRVDATGEDERRPYLVMEYLQGFTVRDIFLRATGEGRVPQDTVAAIILGAARGLHAAHTAVDEQGQPLALVHRDVSPHNLFLTNHGVVKVLDFGIAKGANDVTMTREGHVKGKASYLAPEQLKQPTNIDARTDLFMLGTVAWELFAGRRLFRRATEGDTIQAIRTMVVPDPRSVRSDLDPAYSGLVMRLLARDPNHRPESARKVADELQIALDRRAPFLGARDLASFVARIRELSPVDEETATSAAPFHPHGQGDETTAPVAPPATASWVGASGAAASADGAVAGTLAVAGSARPAALPESSPESGPARGRAGADNEASHPGLLEREPAGARRGRLLIAAILAAFLVGVVLAFVVARAIRG